MFCGDRQRHRGSLFDGGRISILLEFRLSKKKISKVARGGKVEGRSVCNRLFLYCKSFCKELFYVLARKCLNDTANHIYGRILISSGIYSSIELIFHK